MSARAEMAHATAVLLGEDGVLIRGRSGAGKSGLALALLASPPGLARLVGDDRIRLENQFGRLVARPHPLLAGRIERRGVGIEALSHEPAAVIRLVVDFLAADSIERFPAPDDLEASLSGVRLPRLMLVDGERPDAAAGKVRARLMELARRRAENEGRDGGPAICLKSPPR